jgi:hypothetical protein
MTTREFVTIAGLDYDELSEVGRRDLQRVRRKHQFDRAVEDVKTIQAYILAEAENELTAESDEPDLT